MITIIRNILSNSNIFKINHISGIKLNMGDEKIMKNK